HRVLRAHRVAPLIWNSFEPLAARSLETGRYECRQESSPHCDSILGVDEFAVKVDLRHWEVRVRCRTMLSADVSEPSRQSRIGGRSQLESIGNDANTSAAGRENE